MSTIYRKYRPQKFADVVGQDHVLKTLTNEISTGRIAHAYLFTGPRGIGKTTLARLLSKAINCAVRKEGKFEPCDECASCREISLGRNIDVLEIDAASQTGVDNVRENIIESAQFKPTQSKYKVFIIDEVHMLSPAAFNALLKTLEEPPSHVVFILATTELHKLPLTVVSRCQRFGFKAVPYELMMKRLLKICLEEEVKVDEDVLARIVNKSDGSLRDAESLLGQILSLNLKKITADDVRLVLPASDIESILYFIGRLTEKDAKGAIELIGSLATEGVNLDQFAHDLLEVLRAIMMRLAGYQKTNTDYSDKSLKKIKALSECFGQNEIITVIDKTLARKQELKYSPLPELPLQLLAVEICGARIKNSGAAGVNDAAAKTSAKNLPEEKPAAEHTVSSTLKDTLNTLSQIGKKSAPKTTLEEIRSKWPEIIEQLSKTNHALIFVLKMCDLQKMDENGLGITVPYGLHRDKIMEEKNKRIIEDKLKEIFSEKIHINCSLSEKASASPAENEQEINQLAAEFGGEVVG